MKLISQLQYRRFCLVIIAAALVGCGDPHYTNDYVRPTSPFHKYVEHFKPYDSSTENEIKALVLKEVPTGSPVSAIQAFVRHHFTVSEVKKQPTTTADTGPVKKHPYIYVRVWEGGTRFAGSYYLDFIFILDDSDKLQDVMISCDGSWL